MREIEPVHQNTLMNIQALEVGIARISSLQKSRADFRKSNFRDPTTSFIHPKDGLIVVPVDDKLLAAMGGAVLGATRELQADGFSDLAHDAIERGKHEGTDAGLV